LVLAPRLELSAPEPPNAVAPNDPGP